MPKFNPTPHGHCTGCTGRNSEGTCYEWTIEHPLKPPAKVKTVKTTKAIAGKTILREVTKCPKMWGIQYFYDGVWHISEEQWRSKKSVIEQASGMNNQAIRIFEIPEEA